MVSIFDVLKEMGKRNLDIRAFNIWDNLKRVNRGAKNGDITLTVDNDTASKVLMQSLDYGGKRVKGMLLIINEEQYDQILKELEHQEHYGNYRSDTTEPSDKAPT